MNGERTIKLPDIGTTHFRVDTDHQNLVYVTARGRFDVSAIDLMKHNLNRSPFFLNPDRLVLVEFIDSCLGTDDYFKALRRQVLNMVDMGFASKRMAFVISPSIEGHSDAIDQYKQAYALTGITVAFFEIVEDAKAWLLTRTNPPQERTDSRALLPLARSACFKADSTHDHLLRIDCHAPFDATFLSHSIETQSSDIIFLNPKRVELIRFVGNCSTATAAFYKRWGDHILKELSMGFAPQRIAIVVEASESGRDPFVHKLLALFDEHAPYTVQEFSTPIEAEVWLLED